MLANILTIPLPVVDQFFTAWEIPPSLSKIVICFAMFGAYLISRVIDTVKIVSFPICLVFLVAVTAVVNYYLQPMMGMGYTELFKLLVAIGLGQSMAACFLMAFFKTASVQRQI